MKRETSLSEKKQRKMKQDRLHSLVKASGDKEIRKEIAQDETHE